LTTLKDVKEIVKRPPPRKLRLDGAYRETRLIFANWAISKLYVAIFVFIDETSVESYHHRKHSKVSMPKGSNPFDYARPPARTFDYVMFWGAICEGYTPGPFHVWEKETEAEKAANAAAIAYTNVMLSEQENQMRQRARQPDTTEGRVLRELNVNVRRQDRLDPLPSGRPRMLRRPEWEFKIEREERGEKGVGMGVGGK
jgi:hypothetical protein